MANSVETDEVAHCLDIHYLHRYLFWSTEQKRLSDHSQLFDSNTRIKLSQLPKLQVRNLQFDTHQNAAFHI